MDRLAGLYAKHNVLRMGVILAKIVAVVGGYEGNAKIFFKLEKTGMDAVLHFQALILNLEIEILFAENIGEGTRRCSGGVVIALGQTLCNFSFEASRETNEATGVLCEELLAYSRLVIEAVQRSLRRYFDQIAIAFFILGEHQQVVVGIAFGGATVIVLFADVKFATDDRLHACVLCGIDEVDCAKNIAVVGHRHGRHSHLFHALAKFLDVTGAVEHGVVRVQVQVDELGHGSVGSLTQRG
jgi:hypothetical protein